MAGIVGDQIGHEGAGKTEGLGIEAGGMKANMRKDK